MARSKEEVVEANVIALLKARREALGMSYGQLAELTHLHRTAISLIERGERHPTLLTCLKIAAALEIDFSELVKKANK